MTAYGSIASAIDAIKAGAYDYLEKPFCPERVEVIIDNLVKGAAGLAVQNMNLMFGFNEKESLENLPINP